MTDPYHDDIIVIALGVPGVWLAADQDSPGIRLESTRPLREVIGELGERFEAERPWRVAETAVRADGAALTVKSEIDRTCRIYVDDPAQLS